MGCYPEDYRARVGTWAGRFTWRGGAKCRDDIGKTGNSLGSTMISFLMLAVLLLIGGIEQNPGPVAESENTVRLLCSGCARKLKSGIQCEQCERWYHYSCGNVKSQAAERENWCCEKCRMEKVRELKVELQNALRQIEELKARNRELEAMLQVAGAGNKDSMDTNHKEVKCMVVGDSLVRNVGVEYADMKVECFPGIKTDQLHRVLERRELDSAETLIIHVGTNDLRSTRNLDHIMGEAYELVTNVKKKLPNCKLLLSGVLRRRDVSWKRIGALNDRLDWVANAVGLMFVDPNSWIEDDDFSGDGVHLNPRGKRHLGNLYARVSGLKGGGSAERKQ